MPFLQNYNPVGSWPLSTAAAGLPVVLLFVVLVGLRHRVWIAAAAGFTGAALVAALLFKMPGTLVAMAAVHGAFFGLLRFGWIIVGSLFLYNVAVETGRFEVMKRSVAGLSSDPRVQLLLVAFCFGAFLEGTGGGGAPVAIAGAFLIGLGFPPFSAATLCLIANTAPVAWGAIGIPIRVLAGVTGLPEAALSAMTGRILAPLSLLLPFWLVITFVGWRRAREVWPAAAVAGGTFAATQFYWSNYQASGLVDIVAALVSLISMVAFLKVWRPPGAVIPPPSGLSRGQVLAGWSPFLLASLLIFITSLPAVASRMVSNALKIPVPNLHGLAIRVPPVVAHAEPEAAFFDFNILSLPGTVIAVAAVLAALSSGRSLPATAAIFIRTVRDLLPSLVAVSFMVALAFVTRYSGMDTVLGLAMTRTGMLYPFFGTLLGWLGVALTGTDAGSNALFGNLQKVTAEQLGLSPILMASANSAGGVMGKMIDAQSIVVSSSATQQVGREAEIFKAVFKHSLGLAILVGLIVSAYAFLLPGLVPAG